MTKSVKYIGTSQDQIRWGSNDDPRNILIEGKVYEVEKIKVYSLYTKYKLIGINGKFNSVSFEEIE